MRTLKDIKTNHSFQTTITLATGIAVVCSYHKFGRYDKGKWLVALAQVSLVFDGVTVSNHKCGGATTWMDERMKVT